MIYIDNTNLSIDIPKHFTQGYDTCNVLKLVNKSTNVETQLQLEPSQITTDFYQVHITLMEGLTIDTGEYNYFLVMDDGCVIEYGLLTFGDYKPQHDNYDNNVERIQYNG